MFLSLLLSLSAPVAAQSLNAEEVLADMVEAHEALRVFEVAFEHTVTRPDAKPVEHTGRAWFSRDRFRIAYDDIEYYDNDRFVFVQHHDVNRVFVHDDAPGTYWDIDRLFLTDWSQAEVLDVAPEMEAWRLTLKPTGGDVYKAELWVSRESHRILRAILFTSDGSRHAYDLEEFEESRRIPSRVFTFSERRFPDIEILPMTDNYYLEEEY